MKNHQVALKFERGKIANKTFIKIISEKSLFNNIKFNKN